MKTIDFPTFLWQSSQRILHSLYNLLSRKNRFYSVCCVSTTMNIMLIFLINVMTAIIVCHYVMNHGVHQAGQCLFSNQLTTIQQTEKKVLNHVLSLFPIVDAHRDEMDDFITMATIIICYNSRIIH